MTHLGPNEDPSDPATIRWHSVNSGRDDIALCPSDPTYLQGGGTYFGEVYAFQATKLLLEVRGRLVCVVCVWCGVYGVYGVYGVCVCVCVSLTHPSGDRRRRRLTPH